MSKHQLSEFFKNLGDRCITVYENSTPVSNIFIFQKKYDLGYCYYNTKDAEVARKTSVLRLHWGSYSLDQLNQLIVGYAIVDEAKFCNLDVQWSGFYNDDIIIKNVEPIYFQN